jgi:hypothetical protein
MPRCKICGQELPDHEMVDHIRAVHNIDLIRDDPLTALLVLPSGHIISSLRTRVEYFAQAIRDLRILYPGTPFRFIDASSENITPNIFVVASIMAVADCYGMAQQGV